MRDFCLDYANILYKSKRQDLQVRGTKKLGVIKVKSKTCMTLELACIQRKECAAKPKERLI